MRQVFRDLLPEALFYWRTSPPVARSLSDMEAAGQGGGITLDNQRELNDLLRLTVEQSDAVERTGVVVDWWAQINSLGVNTGLIVEEELKVDGMHYSIRPSLSFLNLWLNAVFDDDGSHMKQQ